MLTLVKHQVSSMMGMLFNPSAQGSNNTAHQANRRHESAPLWYTCPNSANNAPVIRAATNNAILDSDQGLAQSLGRYRPWRPANNRGTVNATVTRTIRLVSDHSHQLADTHMITALPTSTPAHIMVLRNKN